MTVTAANLLFFNRWPPYIPRILEDRTGVYHFGMSEEEWDLVVFLHNNNLIIQVWNGYWGEDYYTKEQGSLSRCQTFNHVRYVNGQFYFGKYSGRFVDYNEGGHMRKAALLFFGPPGVFL